jgi:hypothetical protein
MDDTFLIIIATQMSNDKIQTPNGGWGPIGYKIGKIP